MGATKLTKSPMQQKQHYDRNSNEGYYMCSDAVWLFTLSPNLEAQQ